MTTETKQDVFDDALRALEEFGEQGSSWEMAYDDLSARYSAASDAALPDNLPVIPKAVGVSIKEQKAKQSLGGALFDAIFAANELGRKNVGPVVNWMVDNDETYANAWLTGGWRVEETGEIVKLEAEK